mmetsp:Transcript_36212/g.70383  ORF Transcript_36212/g.70383 Transcript_36212/m.70383 type:complete len:196 (-) Transcript_36212:230-817(-)
MGCTESLGMGMPSPPEVEAPEIDMKKVAKEAKKSIDLLSKTKEASVKKASPFPYTLFELLDTKKQKIIECKDAEEKFYGDVINYISACDKKMSKTIADKLWKEVVAANIEPEIKKAVDEALEKEEFASVPASIKSSLKKKAIATAMDKARSSSQFDLRVQYMILETIVGQMKKNGAEISEDFKNTSVDAEEEAKE